MISASNIVRAMIAQGQPPHGRRDFDLRTRPPRVDHLPRAVDGRPRVTVEALRAESRLHEPPLPEPEIPFAQHEPVAVDRAEGLIIRGNLRKLLPWVTSTSFTRSG